MSESISFTNRQDTITLKRYAKGRRSMVSFVPLWFNDFSLCLLRLCDKLALSLGLFFTTEAQRHRGKFLKYAAAFFLYNINQILI